MRKLKPIALATFLVISIATAPSAQAKTAINKPTAPTIASVNSSVAKKGKVNITVTIALPTSDGGSKISGSKVTAGGKSCTMKKLKTSCTIKGLKSGKSLNVVASSKNKKGYGSKSAPVVHIAGGSPYAVGESSPAQTSAPAAAASYKVGDVGPGGGLIYFASSAGFTCGSQLTQRCNYLEVAPRDWGLQFQDSSQYISAPYRERWNTYSCHSTRCNVPWSYQSESGATFPRADTSVALAFVYCANYVDFLDVQNIGVFSDTSVTLGRGLRDSITLSTKRECFPNESSYSRVAATAARLYTGGGKSDWFLPSIAELTELMVFQKSYTFNFRTGATNVFPPYALELGPAYWSSTPRTTSEAWLAWLPGSNNIQEQYWGLSSIGESKDDRGVGYEWINVRPVRAF
jgi:hypothetical protein